MSPRRQVPAARVEIDAAAIERLNREVPLILGSGQLTLGTHGAGFEKDFAAYVGCAEGVAVSCGTAALEILLSILEVRGREVIVPTNTNFGSAVPVMRAGARLRLVDSPPSGNGFDLTKLRANITPRTAAVITVHLGGVVAETLPETVDICREAGIALVEDAAHAHGSAFGATRAGAFGVAGAFSFFATKLLTTGEGGMIVSDDPRIAELARGYRDQGKVRVDLNLHTVLGYSWRLSEIQAALGRAQLDRLDEVIEGRRAIAALYSRLLEPIGGVRPLAIPEPCSSNYYKYVVLLDPEIDRDRLKKVLREDFGVSLSGEIYAVPCHRQPVFAACFDGEGFENADHFCDHHACLPIYSSMETEEAEWVVEALRAALGRC